MSNKVQIIVMYLLIGFVGFATYALLTIENTIVRFLVSDLAMMMCTYVFSVIKRNSSVYDAFWSVIPFYFVLLWMLNNIHEWGLAHCLTAFVVTFWSFRLTHNWFRSWPGWVHEDWRYVNFRNQFGGHFEWINFSAIHLYPTLIVFLSMSGLFFLFDGPQSINFPIIAGCLLSFLGVMLELFADNMLFQIRNMANQNKNRCIRRGLWGVSRNPNYLGEMLFWIGLSIIGIGSGAPLWTCLGAVGMTLMFLFASIPMKEKRLMETKDDFVQYKNEVPKLLPFLPGTRR